MRASGVSLSFHHMSHHPLTLAAGRFLFGCGWFLFLVFWVLLFASCFASVMGFYHSSACLDLDDRQGFTARSATQ